MTDLETRLSQLETRVAISQLRALYCHLADQSRWRDLGELFTEDVTFAAAAEVHGRENLIAFFGEIGRQQEAAWHFVHNETLSIDGDEATGRCYFDAPTVIDGVPHVCAGYYDDEFRRVSGTWLFSSRRLHFFYFAPLAFGWRADAVPDHLPR
jgi:hypothetical protein